MFHAKKNVDLHGDKKVVMDFSERPTIINKKFHSVIRKPIGLHYDMTSFISEKRTENGFRSTVQ